MKKDGIYFGLSEEEYFTEKRIGSTLLRNLMESPAKFWFESYLNPIKKEKSNKCLQEGKIFHKLLLEGEKALMADFAIIPSYMHSASNQFKAWKNQQIRPIIREEDVIKARSILAYLKKDGSVLSDFFSGGYPEVSILWTDERGFKRAARIDYLKVGQFIDLKTFENWESDNKNCSRYFWKYKVFVQLIDYLRAIKAAKSLPVIKGTAKQKAFWEECKEVENWLPWVCFVNRDYPQYKLKTFDKNYCHDLYILGERMIGQALDTLEKYIQQFGPTYAWIDEPAPGELHFNDNDFPQLIGYEI